MDKFCRVVCIPVVLSRDGHFLISDELRLSPRIVFSLQLWLESDVSLADYLSFDLTIGTELTWIAQWNCLVRSYWLVVDHVNHVCMVVLIRQIVVIVTH